MAPFFAAIDTVRHTFASDMVRAGVRLPALMQSMGHAQIHEA